MEKIRISYTDEFASIYEGMNIYLSKFSVKNKKYYLITFITASFLLFVFNIKGLMSGDKYFVYFIVFLFIYSNVTSVLFFHLYVKIYLKHIASKAYLSQKDMPKEVILREDEIVFLREFCKSNYYYDEIEAVIKADKSLSIVLDKTIHPIIISLEKQNNDTLAVFCNFLKEKTADRYIDMSKGGKGK